MNDFMERLLKIRSGFYGKMRLLFILDMIIIFSIIYSILIILNAEYFLKRSFLNLPFPVNIIPPISAFIIALMGALLLHRKDKKTNVTLLIEGK
ncbi:MAG TPA: hypothetical protein VIO11_00585, partial [Candidatus Methanoperedens sp.]